MKRVLLSGIIGGIAMFVWMSLAHMVLPLGRIGVREILTSNRCWQLCRLHWAVKPGCTFFRVWEWDQIPPARKKEKRWHITRRG